MTPKPFSRNPSSAIGVGTFRASERAKQLVMQVLDSHRITYGPMMQKFEADFANLHGCRFGIMSNSGTSALQLGLQAMKEIHGWADGDEVIVPAVTFVATANIVLHNRMVPVLVDVDPIYYGMDSAAIEKAVTRKTRAIIPVHLFGQPADMGPITEIARKHSLKIIEDSAETMFARYNGKPVGNLGDIGCFSTYAAHLVVTGVGGLNTTNNPEYAIKIRSLLNHGRDSIYISIDDDKNVSAEQLRTIVERRFRFVSIGHSFRATEMEAALGLAQLEEAEQNIARRRSNAAFLSRELQRFDNHLQTPQTRLGCDHSFMMYPIVLRNEPKRQLVEALESSGIETRDMLPLTCQPVYGPLLGWREDDYPTAKWINDNGFYVGCHQDLKDGDLEYIVETIETYFRGTRTQKLPSAALVAVGDRNTTAQYIEQLVEFDEIFENIFIVDTGMDAARLAEIEGKGFTLVDAKGNDEFAAFAKASADADFDAVVFYPLSGQWDSADVPRLLLTLNRGYDMVVASRFMIGGGRRGRHGLVRSLGNRIYNLMVNLLFAANVSDSFSSFRAVRREQLNSVRLPSRGMTNHFALSLSALTHGWRVQEIPTVEMTRSSGQVFYDAVKTGLPGLVVMARQFIERRGGRSGD